MKKVCLLSIVLLFIVGCGDVTSVNTSSNITSAPSQKEFSKVDCYNVNNYSLSLNNKLPKLNSLGERKMLVVPLIIKGYEVNATTENLTKLEKAFFGETESVSYESVASYYNKSSYGKFSLSGKVTPWVDLDISSESIKENVNEEHDDYGLYYVVDKVYEWYTSTYDDIDLFDTDKDGFVDSLYLIYSAPNYLLDNNLSNTFWALTTSRYDEIGLEKTKTRFSCFSWSSYDFMFQNVEKDGIDSHTYIHEVGHMLGLKDYYCTNIANIAPMGKVDMMDYDIGDHSAFSKFSLGWVNPYLIDDSGFVNLKSVNETGDCLIFKTDNYNGTPFDEYVMMEFITPTNLNKDYLTGMKKYGSSETLYGFKDSGVRVTLINSVAVDTNGNLTDDPLKMVKMKYTNTGYVAEDYYNIETGMFNVLSTLIPENPNRGHGLFSNTFTAGSKDLFKEGDSFSLKRGDVYRNLIPSQTNKYLKQGAGFFKYQVNFVLMNETDCEIEIIKLDN